MKIKWNTKTFVRTDHKKRAFKSPKIYLQNYIYVEMNRKTQADPLVILNLTKKAGMAFCIFKIFKAPSINSFFMLIELVNTFKFQIFTKAFFFE